MIINQVKIVSWIVRVVGIMWGMQKNFQKIVLDDKKKSADNSNHQIRIVRKITMVLYLLWLNKRKHWKNAHKNSHILWIFPYNLKTAQKTYFPKTFYILMF